MSNKKYVDLPVASARGTAEIFAVLMDGTMKQVSKTVLAADASNAGLVQLAGALGGTAAAPTALGYADAAALATAMAAKAALDSPAFLNNPTAPTQAAGNNSTRLATTAFVATSFAPLLSPALTGTPTVPTANLGTNTTQAASTAFVAAAITALVASSPAALDTLNELAAALGNDANYAATITTALSLKAALASPVFTGNPAAPTQSQGDNSTKLATTAYVDTLGALKSDKLAQTTVGASRDLTTADIGKVLECNTGAGNIVLSVPDSLMSSIGAVYARRNGGNTLTFAPKVGSAVFINDPNSVTAGNHGLIGILWDTGNTYTLIA